MEKVKSWRMADYPNAIPSWKKHPIKTKPTQRERFNAVIKSLDWEKLATLGTESED